MKDNRTPRGRIEPGVQRFSISMLKPIGGSMEEGQSWMTMDRTPDGSRSYLFARHPDPIDPSRKTTVLVAMTCEVCEGRFVTANPTLARFCGARCRKRAQRARQRAA